MDLNKFIESKRAIPGNEREGVWRIECTDGFAFNVGANGHEHCVPQGYVLPYFAVAIGCCTAVPEYITQYAEDKTDLHHSAYPLVPVTLVESLIDLHKGLVTEGMKTSSFIKEELFRKKRICDW